MAVRDRAAYMREYRARKRAEEPRASVHEACDRRIAELEQRIRVLEGELGAKPVVIHDDIFHNLDDLL